MPIVPVVAVILLIVLSRLSDDNDETRMNTWLIQNCPRAIELLGDAPTAEHTGLECTYHIGHSKQPTLDTTTHIGYRGERANGRASFKARRLTERSPWFITESTLTVGDESVDLVACTGGVPDGSMTKPVAVNWGGVVTASTRTDIAVGTLCEGTLRRTQTWVTNATITCGGKVLYTGHSTVEFDRGVETGNPTLHYQDGASSPRAAVHFADTDTAHVWSDSPAWEIEMALAEPAVAE